MNATDITGRNDHDELLTGILIAGGKCRLVTIEKSRMVLDLRSYVLALICLVEDRGDPSKARLLRDWLDNPHGTVTHEFEFLVPRQVWYPYTVRRDDLSDYLQKLVAASKVVYSPKFAWLLNADLAVPELWVLKQFKEVAWHCGPDFLGYSVLPSRLKELIAEHMRNLEIDLREGREDDELPPIE